MITIIADKHQYVLPPAEALAATRMDDYVSVRRRIRAALDDDESLTIYVTNPVLLGWLSDLQRYPESRILWRIVDPSEEFTQLFGVTPADPFTPARIAALQLSNLPRPPDGVAIHPLTWILGHRLDPLWQHDDPPLGHAALLVEWARNRTVPLEPTITALVQAQLERWSTIRPIYRALRASSLAEDSANLIARWALQRYESGWRSTQAWGALPVLDSEPAPSTALSVLREQQELIQAYWNRHIASTPIDRSSIDTALEQMSGLSDFELYALNTMLDRRPDALESRLLQAIRQRFSHLPGAKPMLRSFEAKVAPPLPPIPDPAWPVDRWLYWATQQYMPYYAWVIRTQSGRDHQQACALAYSDWLYKEYPSWLHDEHSPLLLCQYQDMCELIESDARAVIIWLVIDGMTWWQGGIMQELCELHGLHTQAQRPGVAALPSVTSISKRALVTGQPTIDIVQPTIAEAARVKLVRSNIPAMVGYSLPAAVDAIQEDHPARLFVVLFNVIDALAHQSTTFTDDRGIRGYLEELASQLSAAQHVSAAQGRRLHVLIGSDHGSTLLPKDTQSIPLPHTVREVDDIWEPELTGQEAQRPGTRAAATDLDHIPGIDQQLWYALDRDSFQLDRHYLAPRGYSYIKRRPTGWTHGGLTPEETIVPLLHLAPERPHVLPIEVDFQGLLRAGQPGMVTAVLRNLNPFPVQSLVLAVSDATDELTIVQLEALEQYEVEVHFAVVLAKGAELPVTYEVSYNTFGTAHRDVGQASIPLRRLQTEDTSFDDMFN